MIRVEAFRWRREILFAVIMVGVMILVALYMFNWATPAQ